MIKKLLIGCLYAVLLLIGIYSLPGCRKTAGDLSSYHSIGDTKSDSLLIYNLLPDSSYPSGMGYVLYVNDSLCYNAGYGVFRFGLSYGVPSFYTVPAQGGTFTFTLTSYKYVNGAQPPAHLQGSATLICRKTISVPQHSGYGQVIFYDSVGQATMSYMPITSADPGAPAPGAFKLRVINFSYDIPANNTYSVVPNSAGAQYALQLQYPDSTVVKGHDNIPFGKTTDYQQFTYGTQQFLLYNPALQSYMVNSGPLNDRVGAFNVEPVVTNLVASVEDHVYPNYNPYEYPIYSTTEFGNIGSYPFSAGGCYSILVLGNMYAVALDRMYGQGQLDNFGKIQFVNANADEPNIQVTITGSDGKKQEISSLPFGSYAEPVVVPAGPVTCTINANGRTITNYSASVPRLGNYTYYFAEDQNNLPFIFPTNVSIDPVDYYGGYSPEVQLTHFYYLNLSPDSGPVFFTENGPWTGYVEYALQSGLPNEIPFKGAGSGFDYTIDGTYADYDEYGVRLSAGRGDTLAASLAAKLDNPYGRNPCPGTYTLVSIGRLNTTDETKKIRLVMVRQSNFISKAL